MYTRYTQGQDEEVDKYSLGNRYTGTHLGTGSLLSHATFQNLTMPSPPAVAMTLPSGAKATS